MRIALDALGGDDGAEPNVAGCLSALAENEGLHVTLVGDVDDLSDRLRDVGELTQRITLHASDGCVGMDEKPARALREKPNSSIALCWKLMAERQVDAVVSAGNTGAVVAFGLRTKLFLKGVRRPGIAVTLPTANGQAVLLDAGANPGARPEHLLQYSMMGHIYARDVLGIDSPKIGLLNIGSEDSKGTDLYRQTHQLLVDSPWSEHYTGNVEGRGIFGGEVDVVVCEGFVGNVVLKSSEGMAEFLLRSVLKTLMNSLDVERDRAQQAIGQLAKTYQYQECGGAPLLGIDGICMICHGSSDARSIANALHAATRMRDREVNRQITSELQPNPV